MESIEHSGNIIKRWQVGPSTFTAWPEAGARLMSWNVKVAGNEREVIYWPYGKEDFTDIAEIRGGNPILFPFSGRTYDKNKVGVWNCDGVKRPMKPHGYAGSGRFQVETEGEEGFRAVFLPCEACKEAYPYKYEFAVEYRFKELSLEVDFCLTNNDDKQIPWSAGNHFYFKLPWHQTLSRSDYSIRLPAKKAWYHSADGSLVPIKGFEELTKFSDPTLLNRIHTKLKTNEVLFGPNNSEENIGIRVSKELIPPAGLAVVVWTEHDESPFYCVEPWMGAPNSPSHKKGLHYVQAGETEVFTTEVSLL